MTAGKNLTVSMPVACTVEAAAVLSRRDLEAGWVRASAAGDREAFRMIYQAYVGRVRATLARLGAQTQLDDATQEVFLRVWRSLPSLQDPQLLGTWIYRIATNVATDTLRAQKKDKRLGTRAPEEAADQAVELNAKLPTDQADAMHARRVVAQALAGLDEKSRQLVVLADLEDLDQKDIAAVLQVPLGTVKSRLFAARKRLRALLEKQGVEL